MNAVLKVRFATLTHAKLNGCFESSKVGGPSADCNPAGRR
jgi:hypothetical protein